jgi:hypothetical protein
LNELRKIKHPNEEQRRRYEQAMKVAFAPYSTEASSRREGGGLDEFEEEYRPKPKMAYH